VPRINKYLFIVNTEEELSQIDVEEIKHRISNYLTSQLIPATVATNKASYS
jgi:hypothetical protein